jgi:hypothetical protein
MAQSNAFKFANNILTNGGYDAADLVGAVGGSSDYVRLATATITANTTAVTFDGYFSSTYDTYIIYGSNIILDGSANISIRYRQSGSDVISSTYTNANHTINSINSRGFNGQTATGTPQLNGSPPSYSTYEGLGFQFTISDPNNNQATKYKHMEYRMWYTDSSGYLEQVIGAIINTSSTAVLTGFKILPSANNFDAGTMVLYGVKK